MRLLSCSPVLLIVVSAATSAVAVPVFAGKQSRATLPSFDVASVKPDDPNDRIRGYRELDAGGGIMYRAYTLRQLIMEAYRLRPYQLSGGPGWVNGELFNIEAKPPANSAAARVKLTDPRTTPPPDELLMLRSLLADRFQLELSKEERQGTVYSLEPVRGESSESSFTLRHTRTSAHWLRWTARNLPRNRASTTVSRAITPPWPCSLRRLSGNSAPR